MSAQAARTVGEVLAARAAERPDAPLAVSPETGRVATRGDAARYATAFDARLREAGVPPGAHVALLAGNGLQTTLAFLATMAGGRVIAPLNLLSQRAQLAYVLDHCDCALLLVGREQLAQLADAMPKVERRFAVLALDVDADRLALEPVEGLPDRVDAAPPASGPSSGEPGSAPALLMYTSGTTGRPKGVMLTHANLLAGARTVADWHGLGPDDRVMSSLPLYHINGQVIGTLAPLVSGGSLVAPHRFSTSAWWDAVVRWRCTWINMVPTIIAYLLNAAAGTRPEGIGHVRFGRSASAPLPPEHHAEFERVFGLPVIEAMGMTESSSVVFCNPMRPPRKIGSPGVPCGVEARIVDPRNRPLPDDAVGEIVLRGPNVMGGYYKSPEQTAQAIDAEGWLHTGDLGRRDADGFYFVTGRLKELIIKGGENIAPREVDEVLLRHPAVLEAAAFAVRCERYGQDVAAAVVPRPGVDCDPDAVRAFCVEELGRYKSPRRVVVVDALPKGPSGKVQRLQLAGELADAA